jgi:hypothetical protein
MSKYTKLIPSQLGAPPVPLALLVVVVLVALLGS